jgi:hypothetical protein
LERSELHLVIYIAPDHAPLELDAEGRIKQIHVVLASRKLTAVR